MLVAIDFATVPHLSLGAAGIADESLELVPIIERCHVDPGSLAVCLSRSGSEIRPTWELSHRWDRPWPSLQRATPILGGAVRFLVPMLRYGAVAISCARYGRCVADLPVRYRSPDEDSGRWNGFRFREGDIVISTRSKSGTTWVQMICALLVFQRDELPLPLAQLSPWMDWVISPREAVHSLLDDQQHRRIIKTHTPLDGIPIETGVTYIVVARHPLDMAVSLYHQGDNLDRARLRQLSGEAPASQASRPELREWLLAWIDRDVNPRDELDSLPGVMWHLDDAWRRRHKSGIVLVHYDDLSTDLDREMRRLAGVLGIAVNEMIWPALVSAAGFERMQAHADYFAPDPAGVLKDPTRFFRRGTSGEGHEVLTSAEVAHYQDRAAQLAPADLLAWLHSQPDHHRRP